MTWGLVITKPAARTLRDIPRDDAHTIDAVFEEMRSDPYSGDIKFLKGTERVLRRRVGAWRILFDVDSEKRIVIILGIVGRSSHTY
jgi:mRNA-degrading endonuclease RelE of RelBE toxin-antitoxin system